MRPPGSSRVVTMPPNLSLRRTVTGSAGPRSPNRGSESTSAGGVGLQGALSPAAPDIAARRLAAMTVRFGLVGYATGGRVFHAPLLASASNVDFAGVVTTSPDRRAQVAAAGLTAYDDLAALAADGVRAVAISTPAPTHAELARQAI